MRVARCSALFLIVLLFIGSVTMPAVWTSPPVWADDMPISVGKLNQLIGQDGDLDYLLKGRQIVDSVVAKGADTGTTSTTFIDVDATNYKITITPKSTRVKVTMSFAGYAIGSATALSQYDILRVGGSRAGHATHGLGSVYSASAAAHSDAITIIGYFTGLVPDTAYEFRLQFRTTNAANSNIVLGALGEVVHMTAEEI